MTVAQLLSKIKKFWLILIILPTIATVFGVTQLATNIDYKASVSLGLSANSKEFGLVSGDNYDRYLTTLSEFLSNRLKSVEVQKIILTDMGLPDSKIDQKKPIYEITNQNSGYVNVSGVFDNKDKAEKFLTAVKKGYQAIVVTEKSQNENQFYKIQPQTQFLETVIEVRTPIQVTVLPTILGILLALIIIILIPIKDEKNALKKNKIS